MARCWAGVWGTLSGQELPDQLTEGAARHLAGLTWARKGRPSPELLTSLRDAPREGPVRDEIRGAIGILRQRL